MGIRYKLYYHCISYDNFHKVNDLSLIQEIIPSASLKSNKPPNRGRHQQQWTPGAE